MSVPKKFSRKMKGDMINQDVQFKKDILLFAYKCVHDHIISCIKISYEIGFGTVTAIILIVGYSFSSNQLMLLSVIPFIFAVGAFIYYHVIMSAFILGRYNLKIEKKLKDLINLNLLDMEQQLGIFGTAPKTYTKRRIFPLLIIFLLGYLVSIVTGTYFIWIQNKMHGLMILAVYFILSGYLVFSVYPGIKYIIEQRKGIGIV